MSTGLPKYTDIDRRRTRVYRPEADANRTLVPDEAPGIGGTQPIALKKEGLFDGLSVAQVLAGAGAAATSVLLASKIGVYGSVIGAAVSSVVTVLATQVYRKALTAGAKKLSSSVLEGEPRVGARPGEGLEAEGAGIASYANGAQGARLAPTKLQARAAAQRAAVQRKVVLASAVVAVAAVALCAGGVLLATAGEGLGDRAPALFGATEDAAGVQGTDEPAPAADGTRTTGDAGGDPTGQATASSSKGGGASSSSASTDTGAGAATGTDSSSSGTASSTGTAGDSSSSDAATDTGTDSGSSDSASSGTATDLSKTDGSATATGTASAS